MNLTDKFPTEDEIADAAENELNNTYGVDWDDLIGIFENAVKWVKEYVIEKESDKQKNI